MIATRGKVIGSQIQAARGLLGISATELAAETKLSRGTVQRAEIGNAPITVANFERIIETLERMGIIFIPANGDGPGVRLRKRKR